MIRLIMLIASGLGAGYLPAPGTWGSLVALPVNLLLIRLPGLGYPISLAVLFLLAVYTAGAAEKILDRKDPGLIVIDEVVGMLIVLLGVPVRPLPWLLAFGLFRLFDIAKPWPVSWADRHLNGGLGIVLDDVLAGAYAWLFLRALLFFFPSLGV